MNDPHLKRVAILIVVALAILAAGSLYLFARPAPPTPAPAVSPAVAQTATTSSTQPKITWSVNSVVPILAPGESSSNALNFVSSGNLTNAVVEAVPAIAPFITISPNSLANVPSGQPQSVQITFSIPRGTALGTYDGTIHLRVGSTTFPQTLKLSLAVGSQRVTLFVPEGYQVNSQALGLGGPVSLNNFGNAYLQGGVVPPGGGEIDITSVKLPSIPLMQFITNELQGATTTSTTAISVSGNAATEVLYTDTYTPTLAFKNIAVYVPFQGLLYKIYLTYRAGEPLENQFLASFQQILDNIQFIQ